jgi:two-component system LytT family response regulator
MIRAFVVDDESLAIKRLARLLAETGRVEIAGSATDPVDALAALHSTPHDVLFLDIQMPGMTGFELINLLETESLIVFTTAYDQYALKAFEANAVDYLLKPIESAALDRALTKAERIIAGRDPRPDLAAIIGKLTAALPQPARHLDRIASKVGDRVHVIELDRVTHFYAESKLTFASAQGKSHIVDFTIAQLEEKLDPAKWVRIHRSTLLNLAYLLELDAWFGGRVIARLKDTAKTELQVARDRVKVLKERLGIG